MQVRRGLVALTVVTALFSGVSPVFAQVDEAEQRAREAADDAAAAYAIVSSAVANAEEVEAALFAALDEYRVAASDLALAGIRLDRIIQSLALADAEAVNAEQQLKTHTVTAYMEAVTSSASLLMDTDTVEDVLVVGQVVRESQSNALRTLGDLMTQRNELDRIRAEHAIELVQVESLAQALATRTSELQDLFTAANAEVAVAFSVASAADSAYRAALDDVDRAIAEDEAAQRATEAATTTTTRPPTTTATTDTTTTTTTEPSSASWPPIPISDRTMAWRPSLERHFAPGLVLDALVIIQCESAGNADANNPYSGASGLFQFLPGTWAVASVQAGVGDRSVFDGEANIIAASWLAEYYRNRVGEPWKPWSCRAHL